jgi:hypothetical protein
LPHVALEKTLFWGCLAWYIAKKGPKRCRR